jgi:HSP20 family protein
VLRREDIPTCMDTNNGRGRSVPERKPDPNVTYRLAYGYRMPSQTDAWRPALEVYETERALVVRVELAGVDEQDLNVALDGDLLTIFGERVPAMGAEGDAQERRSYHEMGIPYGPFRARVQLPVPIVRDEVEASYEHGFLTVTLPRAKRVRIRPQLAQPVGVGAAQDEATENEPGKDPA